MQDLKLLSSRNILLIKLQAWLQPQHTAYLERWSLMKYTVHPLTLYQHCGQIGTVSHSVDSAGSAKALLKHWIETNAGNLAFDGLQNALPVTGWLPSRLWLGRQADGKPQSALFTHRQRVQHLGLDGGLQELEWVEWSSWSRQDSFK